MAWGTCPRCQVALRLGGTAEAPEVRAVILCPACRAENGPNAYQCSGCGGLLHDDALSGLIPYKNVPALVGYYLAVFSIIPFIGIVLGIAGFICGLVGLRQVHLRPEVKGTAHALVGIIAGGVFGFGWLILLIVLIASSSR